MCLITRQKEPFVADKDITVWKLMYSDAEGVATSMYYSIFTYILGLLYVTEMVADNEPSSVFDTEVLNHYDINLPLIDSDTKHLTHVHEGFHSFICKERAMRAAYHRAIYECTIPKGSLYFLDETGLCVSNQIIINKKL